MIFITPLMKTEALKKDWINESGRVDRNVLSNALDYAIDNISEEIRVTAKIRYNHRGAEAVLRKVNDQYVECLFDRPQRAPTPGQALVCYKDGYVIGGGTIQ